MLDRIKLLLGLSSTDKDELLMVMIESAIDEAKNYTHNDDIAGYENVICNMVVHNYNRLDSSGLTKEAYSGVTFEYASDYPDSIIRQLKAHRKLIAK